MKIYKALSDFQNEVPVIHKGTQGYGYSYADLPAIFEVINPLLKKHKLGFTQPIMGDTIKTIIFHTESGETIESLTQIPQGVVLKGMNDFQVLGSAISYLRRYSLSSILGVISDKDTDAGGEQVPIETDRLRKQKEVTGQKKKEKITTDRFEKACQLIADKKYSIESLKASFELTELQEKALLTL